MSIVKDPTEGGSGGKRGHSNMEHWGYTEEVKDNSKSQRRIDDKSESDEGVEEYENEKNRSID